MRLWNPPDTVTMSRAPTDPAILAWVDAARATLCHALHRSASLEHSTRFVRARLSTREVRDDPAGRARLRKLLAEANAELAQIADLLPKFVEAAADADALDPRPMARRGALRTAADCDAPDVAPPRERTRGAALEHIANLKRLHQAAPVVRRRHHHATARLLTTARTNASAPRVAARPRGCDGRPRARRAANRGRTRAGPSSDSDPGEPPPPSDGGPPHLLAAFGEALAELGATPAERLTAFLALPADAQAAAWRSLRRAIDRDRERER